MLQYRISMGFPAMWKTWVRSLGWEDALEKELASHSSSLAWEIPQTEEPGGLESMGSQRVGHDWGTNTHKIFLSSSPTCGAVDSSSLIFILLLFLMYWSINNLMSHNQLISELRIENPCLSVIGSVLFLIE